MRKAAISVKDWIIGFLLFWVAFSLFLPLTLINYVLVVIKADDHGKGYFLNTATNLDKFANQEFRMLWNTTMINKDGYRFGLIGETISSVLGKNKVAGTLSVTGRVLASILDAVDKNHCINSINKEVSW